MLRRSLLGLTVVLLVGLAVAPMAADTVAPATGPEAKAATGEAQRPLTTPDGFDNTAFRIRVFENSSARWTVQHSRVLDNETERERFETFAETFNRNDTDTFRTFRNRAAALVAFGTDATGRQMNATLFSRSAGVTQLGQTRGVVSLSFVWTNFARRTDAGVVVDDVFEGGMYIDSGQRLVVARGPSLTFRAVRPPPDSRSVSDSLAQSETVTWFGQRQFADSRPRIVLTAGDPQADAGPGGTATRDATPAAGSDPTSGGSRGAGAVMVVVVLVVLAGVGGGIAWYSGALDGVFRNGPGRTTAGDAGTGESGAATTGAGTEPGTGTGTAPVPEEDLLSDEDRVLRLLRENGGRMKQVNIVEETGWSKSKVSMLLSEMDDADQISKLRVGRENIISLVGEEPDAFGSPFEEE